jgi:hypothetical protein
LKLAAGNIRDNTGEVVSDEQVNVTIRKALDEVLNALLSQSCVQDSAGCSN